ncbi:MAG TPA: hypothetical protein VJP79_09450 [Nitrososphaera sp.]|nr:hypothetical protein [Nitrososphaera sp.]
MKLRSKLALVSALTAALFCPVLAPVANAETVQGQVTIVSAQTCGLNFVSGSPINYGSLSQGQLSAEQTLAIDNTGNAQGSLSVSGTQWTAIVGAQSVNVMNVGATQYAPTPGAPYGAAPKVPLTTSPVTVGNISPTTNMNLFWQLRADLAAGQTGFTGATTQTVTLTAAC